MWCSTKIRQLPGICRRDEGIFISGEDQGRPVEAERHILQRRILQKRFELGNQRRFAVAMLEHGTKKEAAKAIGLEPNTVYKWGVVDEVVALMSNDIVNKTIDMLSSAATKAAMIKLAGLDSDSEKTRQDAASEILDRVLGKPKQRQEVTGKDGDSININFVWEEQPNEV